MNPSDHPSHAIALAIIAEHDRLYEAFDRRSTARLPIAEIRQILDRVRQAEDAAIAAIATHAEATGSYLVPSRAIEGSSIRLPVLVTGDTVFVVVEMMGLRGRVLAGEREFLRLVAI